MKIFKIFIFNVRHRQTHYTERTNSYHLPDIYSIARKIKIDSLWQPYSVDALSFCSRFAVDGNAINGC